MIGQALATLWMVVHSVQGIMFKDLKQISCTKCITIHRVIVCSVFGSSWHSSEFFCQYYSGLFDNSLKYFLHNIFFIISGMEMIGQALATLWMVVHSVQGIMFKNLKQISCTKCITIHRVIFMQIAQFLAQADILVNFFFSVLLNYSIQ